MTFFDSYAFPPSYYNLEEYINKTSQNWTFNKKRIQGSSEFCGIYCILFLIYKTRNQANIFFRQFSQNYTKNDEIIKKLFNNF